MRPNGFPLYLLALALVPTTVMGAELENKPDLRFKLHSGIYIMVPCRIDARVDLSCLLDTGTWPTIVDRSCAARHELGHGPRETLSLVDRVVPISSGVAARFGLGGITMESLPVSVRELSDLGTLIGIRADVILGLDVLRQCNFCLDFESRSVSFEAGSPMKYFVPMLDFGPDPIVVEAEIDGLPANLLIDTGTPGTVLFPSRLRDRQHRPETQRLRPEKVPEGNTIIREITLQQLRIGAWSRKYVRVTAFADPPPRLPPVDGLLSLQTLGCRRICFDFSRKAVSWQ